MKSTNDYISRALVVRSENLNDSLLKIYKSVIEYGRKTAPRGQEVLEWPAPVILDLSSHSHPWTFIPGRRLNPYFAIAEVIWILAGRQDVEFISYYNKNIAKFSDDGKLFHGAYGDRIRNFPIHVDVNTLKTVDSIDQLQLVIRRLRKDADTRQAVICLWDPARDLKDGSKDYPCNNICYTAIRENKLSMTVVRRSNDMVWGLPYNQIQFYFLHAILAGTLGLEMGNYFEFVQNMHVYTNQYKETYARIVERIHGQEVNFTMNYNPTKQIDRRISFEFFQIFSGLFFPNESLWRNKPDLLTEQSLTQLQTIMRAKGVPEYWINNMLGVPAAYIAKRAGNTSLWSKITQQLEPGLQWLVNDFKNASNCSKRDSIDELIDQMLTA